MGGCVTARGRQLRVFLSLRREGVRSGTPRRCPPLDPAGGHAGGGSEDNSTVCSPEVALGEDKAITTGYL